MGNLSPGYIPNHELSSSVRGSARLVTLAVLYWLAAIVEKAIAVLAPMLGSTATMAETSWNRQNDVVVRLCFFYLAPIQNKAVVTS